MKRIILNKKKPRYISRIEKNIQHPVKIIVIVEGGLLRSIISNVPVRFASVDFDKDTDLEKETPLMGVFDAELHEGDLKEIYNQPENILYGVPGVFTRMYQELISYNF
ncbi:hypothetical protein HGH93_21725 [Chitinophaga polysaccharea]|uniref:hypothetical protein n=1 Tax=Chitinophaga polysaccharea TaxID=1293035 RepID=UPI0014550960|nr:hypothetical protein [Chitinophaga polysaccharea]NLR60745.1 hypothetical protein [Chitinophaga polysaccharea]